MDICIEKLFGPLVGAPTKTEAMDVDTMDDALYCGRLEEDDDIIIIVEDDKAMQKCSVMQQLRQRHNNNYKAGRVMDFWWVFIMECSIPCFHVEVSNNNDSYADDSFVSNDEPSGKCTAT